MYLYHIKTIDKIITNININNKSMVKISEANKKIKNS